MQGITVDTYSKISDKGNFRILLEENGMNYPKYQIITKYEQLDFKKIEFPVLSLIHISEPTRRVVISYAVFCLKKIFFNDTATTEIYTRLFVGSVRCV